MNDNNETITYPAHFGLGSFIAAFNVLFLFLNLLLFIPWVTAELQHIDPTLKNIIVIMISIVPNAFLAFISIRYLESIKNIIKISGLIIFSIVIIAFVSLAVTY